MIPMRFAIVPLCHRYGVAIDLLELPCSPHGWLSVPCGLAMEFSHGIAMVLLGMDYSLPVVCRYAFRMVQFCTTLMFL